MKFDKVKLPRHVAIIMDGNRRWARAQGLTAVAGHRYVEEKVIEPLVDRAIELGIKYITFWAFSTENWKRDEREIAGIMRIFRRGLQRRVETLFQKGVRLRVIGNLSRFPKDIQEKCREWIEISKNNTAIDVTFALNYGGRDDILRAVREIGEEVRDLRLLTKELDEVRFSAHLDTAGMPDPDLIIRPGGEKRLSGFMLWQAAYAEIYFSDVLMPDFGPEEFDRAIEFFSTRERRFGGGKFADYKRS